MRGGKRPGAGRPTLPEEKKLKTRTIRMTDDEYLKVKEYVKSLRASKWGSFYTHKNKFNIKCL